MNDRSQDPMGYLMIGAQLAGSRRGRGSLETQTRLLGSSDPRRLKAQASRKAKSIRLPRSRWSRLWRSLLADFGR